MQALNNPSLTPYSVVSGVSFGSINAAILGDVQIGQELQAGKKMYDVLNFFCNLNLDMELSYTLKFL